MYYSSGNYEAFAHPKKPEGVDNKSAYLIGSGLAALTAACYLVRDGQMKGEHIHLFEKGSIPGGACDGCQYPGIGYVMRGGREMDDHFEVMWDLFRSIPSLETEGASVLDEYYWLNKADPNYSLCRATENRGQNAHTDGKFGLSDQGCMELIKLFFTPDEQLYDKRITDVFDAEVFSSNFWLYWRTMFAFENWHSALEMKLYIQRYIHHIGGLPDFTALRFTKYNQYESMILPMIRYLEGHGVRFHYNTKVTNIEFELTEGKKQARTICLLVDDEAERVDLTENDLVFITNGGCVESCTVGAQNKATGFDPAIQPGNGWDLWKKIAAQDPSFGHPEKFCSEPELSNWESATITTLDDKIPQYIRKICKRDPFSGHTVTGGIVTVKDSSWLMSWTINRQPQFRTQPKDHCLVWVYSLFTDKPGDSYYFLQWDNADGLRGFSMGERNFTHEYVFQQLANQIHSTLPGWKPYSPYGLPFSDKGFDGQKRTIEVREIIQLSSGTWRQKRMARKFWLYAISKPYYDYLVSSIINRTDNKGIQGGLIDLGLADPVKIFSNVDGGVGIVGCYTSDSQTIDVIKEIGPFPKY